MKKKKKSSVFMTPVDILPIDEHPSFATLMTYFDKEKGLFALFFVVADFC